MNFVKANNAKIDKV